MAALEMLWHLAAENAPDGGVGRFSDEELEAELGWRGEGGALVAMLMELGWLDTISGPSRLYVHDWHEHADHTTHRKLARARLFFANGAAPKCSTLPEKERAEASEYYASNSRVTREQLQESLQGQGLVRVRGQGQGQGATRPRYRSAASVPIWASECAKILGELLAPVQGARFPRGWEKRWAGEIARIPSEVPGLTINGAEPGPQVEAAIRWALGPENLGREYEVVIRSGKALREKWPKLVQAARRRRVQERPREEMEAWVKSYGL